MRERCFLCGADRSEYGRHLGRSFLVYASTLLTKRTKASCDRRRDTPHLQKPTNLFCWHDLTNLHADLWDSSSGIPWYQPPYTSTPLTAVNLGSAWVIGPESRPARIEGLRCTKKASSAFQSPCTVRGAQQSAWGTALTRHRSGIRRSPWTRRCCHLFSTIHLRDDLLSSRRESMTRLRPRPARPATLPVEQLVVLGLMRASEPICLTSVFPYLVQHLTRVAEHD